MKIYIPKIYRKNLFDINFDILKKKNIRCIIFDLDNTLMRVDENTPSIKTKELLDLLKKDFIICFATNNKSNERARMAAEFLGVDYVNFALKPFSRGFKKLMRKYRLKKEECANIGDQIVTDIICGNRLNMFTILIDPISTKELKVTKFNRFFENIILKRLNKKNLFRRGEYYE